MARPKDSMAKGYICSKTISFYEQVYYLFEWKIAKKIENKGRHLSDRINSLQCQEASFQYIGPLIIARQLLLSWKVPT